MVFVNTFNLGDVLALISIVLMLGSGIFAYVQWKKKQQFQRAEYINELTEMIRTDEDIREIVYLIDYNNVTWYTPKFHDGGDFERKIDKTLSYFSYIYLCSNGWSVGNRWHIQYPKWEFALFC